MEQASSKTTLSGDKPEKVWDSKNENNESEYLGNESEDLGLRDLLRPSPIAMTICGCHKYEVGFGNARKQKTQTYRMLETAYRIIFFFVPLAAVVKACVAFASNFVIFLSGTRKIYQCFLLL